MKRWIVCVLTLFLGVAHGAEMVNVQYLHNLISREWQIDVKYNLGLESPNMAVNMKYLLTAVDVAKQRTMVMVSSQRIRRLIQLRQIMR